MSIFQAREWWSAEPEPTAEEGEEEDGGGGGGGGGDVRESSHLDSVSVAVSSFPWALGHDADALIVASLGGRPLLLS